MTSNVKKLASTQTSAPDTGLDKEDRSAVARDHRHGLTAPI